MKGNDVIQPVCIALSLTMPIISSILNKGLKSLKEAKMTQCDWMK